MIQSTYSITTYSGQSTYSGHQLTLVNQLTQLQSRQSTYSSLTHQLTPHTIKAKKSDFTTQDNLLQLKRGGKIWNS